MVSPLPGMTCLKRNQYIGQNLGFDSLNDNGGAGGHFVYNSSTQGRLFAHNKFRQGERIPIGEPILDLKLLSD